MNLKEKYQALSDGVIDSTGSAKIKLETTKNKLERVYHIMGQDDHMIYDGIKWNFPINLFCELNSNNNLLKMTFNIQSTQDTTLNVDMNYETDAGVASSVNQGVIILKAGKTVSVEKLITLNEVKDAVRAVPMVRSYDAANADFYISELVFEPVFAKLPMFAKELANPAGNGPNTQLQYSEILGEHWTTALIRKGVIYGGVAYKVNPADFTKYIGNLQDNQLHFSFDLLTDIATDIAINLNLSDSADKFISSTPLGKVKSKANQVSHNDVVLPINHDENAVNAKLLIMGTTISTEPFSVSVNNASIKATSQLPKVPTDSSNARLPIVKLTGDVSQMSKDQKVMLQFEFNDHGRVVTGYSKTKWQGDSSLHYPKKSYKIKLYADAQGKTKKEFVPFAGWKADKKFNMKGNYNDSTFARNVVNSGLFADVTANRHGLRPELVKADSFATVKGQPVMLYINGKFNGIYTFNTTKDVYMNMDKTNDDHIVIGGSDWTDATLFKTDAALLDETDFEIIQNAGNDDDTKTKFNRLMKFVNSSTDEEFKAHASEYLDIPSMIDWLVFTVIIQAEDSFGKNTMFATWDGNVWSATAYDLDTSWSMYFDGKQLVDPAEDLFAFHGNKLYQRIFKTFKADFKTRYAELRSTVMTASNVLGKFTDWYYTVGEENYEAEKQLWNAPSFGVTSLAQLKSDIPLRLLAVDKQVAAK